MLRYTEKPNSSLQEGAHDTDIFYPQSLGSQIRGYSSENATTNKQDMLFPVHPYLFIIDYQTKQLQTKKFLPQGREWRCDISKTNSFILQLLGNNTIIINFQFYGQKLK